MTLDEAIAELTRRITAASADAVVRVTRVSEERLRALARDSHVFEGAIKQATQDLTLQLLTADGLDVQVLVYDIATSLPPEE